MKDNLNNLLAWQKNGGSLISQPVLQSIYNYLVLAIDNPAAFTEEPLALREFIQKINDEWVVVPETPAYNQAQQLKLQLLETGYRFRLQQQTANQLKAGLQALEKTASWRNLAVTRPDLYRELEDLAKGVQDLAKP